MRGQFGLNPCPAGAISRARARWNWRCNRAGCVGHLPITPRTASTVEATFAGQQPSRLGQLAGEQPLGVRANDLTANRRTAQIPLYQLARYRNLYPGIDFVFHGRQSQPEFDFELAAGADPSQIRLNLRGHQRLTRAPDGSLTIDAAGGQIR